MANVSEKVVGVGSGVTHEERQGRDDTHKEARKKERGASKDFVAGLDKRVVDVETSMTNVQEQVEESHKQLEELSADFVDLRDGLKGALNLLSGDLRREVQELRTMFMGEVSQLRKDVEKEITAIKDDIALCKLAIASGPGGSTGTILPRVEIPKPSPFVGKREARAVDDFLWEMEQYLDGVSIKDDAMKIKTATRYLKDTAALWWRRRYGDIGKGTCTIDTWADFVKEIKKQFYPENAKDEAKSRLRKLKQTGTIKDYIKEFTNLVLEIPDLSDQDSLFYFLDGLQAWAKTELRRRGVQDLATAIAEAEALIDFSRKEPSKPKDKDRKASHEKGGAEKQAQQKEDHARKPPLPKNKDLKTAYKRSGCFICDGPHRAYDCPKRANLHTMEASEEGCPKEDVCMGSMQILNAIKAKTEAPKVETKGLQFVEANIQGNRVRALVDTGATHNFVSTEEAKRLGISATKGVGAMKTVNSAAKPIHGVAKDVRARIGEWEGTIDLSVVPMDDFKIVLGLEFLDKVRAFPMPFANSLCILDGGKTCMVSTERGPKTGAKTLSAMQFKKGYNKNELCYLAVTKQEQEGESSKESVPKEIKQVLEEFKDVMPKELPKRLPPRREVDHEIELEPGSKPPAKAPYRMPPPELEELRKQLKELLDAGYIRPSKAPYGAPVLFQRKKDKYGEE